MAFMTAEQEEVVRQLTNQYGTPHRVFIENTTEPYGVVRVQWVQWRVRTTMMDVRNLFINPDGSRLSWSLLRD